MHLPLNILRNYHKKLENENVVKTKTTQQQNKRIHFLIKPFSLHISVEKLTRYDACVVCVCVCVLQMHLVATSL